MPLNVTLASSLLAFSIDGQDLSPSVFRTGVTVLDKELPPTLFCPQTIVGVGTDATSVGRDLSLEIVATHLLEWAAQQQTGKSVGASVFVVAPPGMGSETVRRVYGILTNRLEADRQSKREKEAVEGREVMGGVSLLQYLDVSGLVEALGEVLAVVSERREKSIVMVQGLAGCLSNLQRRSGFVQSAALCKAVFGALRNVVGNSAGSCLGLVEADVRWVGTRGGQVGEVAGGTDSGAGMANMLNTAFASETGKVMKMDIGNTMAGIVEESLDEFVAVHDGDGRVGTGGDSRRIVEVVRDERIDVPSALGSWAVW